MARVRENWERLVRATLNREQLRSAGQGHERTSSVFAGEVPPSLVKSTNIDAILQAADEIQSEDPSVSRIRESVSLSPPPSLPPSLPLLLNFKFWSVSFFYFQYCFGVDNLFCTVIAIVACFQGSFKL